MDMLIAWSVVFVAGLATLACVFVLTRRISAPWWRTLLRCLAAVWLLTPARIEVVPGYYAPAFIVALFEGVFRTGGDPSQALLLLTGASFTVIVVLLVMLAIDVRRARNSHSIPQQDSTASD